MRKLLYLLLLLFSGLNTTTAQTQIGGVINDYAAVVSLADADCFNSIEVDDASAFSRGDRAMLIQMNGAETSLNNDFSFGNILNFRSAGRFEIVEVDSISGNTLFFQDSLINQYDFDAVQQLVRIPQYTDVLVTTELRAQPWDGSTGGIIALEASGAVSIRQNITVAGMGFQGGRDTRSGGAPCVDDHFLPSNSSAGARKGEGIVILDAAMRNGRGKAANGGGGGNMHNGGGGGGSSYGPGGKGGDACNQCCGNFSPDRGGFGGVGIGRQTNRIFMGGGGGQGHINDNRNLRGGNGGGIIFIRASRINMQGGRIMASGQDGQSSGANDFPTDGHPGAGGGGTILLDAPQFTGLGSFEARGGSGGNNNTIGSEGPGGGGGGGVVIDVQNSLPVFSIVLTGGGDAGTSNGGRGRNHGATDGGNGGRLGSFDIPESAAPFEILEDLNLVVDAIEPCAGETINFASSIAPNLSNAQYVWDGPGVVSNGQDNFTVTGITVGESGTYSLEVTAGCVTLREEIVINVLPEYDQLIDTFICAGEQYAMGGRIFNATGLYRASLQTNAGCDSLVRLDLEVIPPFFDTTFIQLCSGDTYDGDSYFSDTLLLASLSSAIGCDSFEYTSIQVYPVYNLTENIESCSGDVFMGQVLNRDTTIIENNQTAFGCDSITSFQITVHPTYDFTINDEICQGDLYRGGIYLNDTSFVDQLLTVEGCDSIITTFLSVRTSFDQTDDVELCSGESYLGVQYFNSTSFTDNYITSAGCDSNVTRNITVYPVYDDVFFPEICSGEQFNGVSYIRDTIIIYNLLTTQGCDSITTYNLRVHPTYDLLVQEEICNGESFRGIFYPNDTILVENLQTLNGCDSIVRTNLLVHPTYDQTDDVELCSGESYLGVQYFNSTSFTDNYITSAGCDSNVTRNITVYPVYDDVFFPEICSGERFNGVSYIRDTVIIYNLLTTQGCDSVTTYNLRVYPTYDLLVQEEICNGESFRGIFYPNDTILVENLQTLDGCDSIVRTNLLVHPTYDEISSVDLCAGDTYEGVIYTQNDVVTINYSTINGCDSTVTTNINVFPTYDETSFVEICQGDAFDGQIYLSDTVVVELLQTADGCDSILRTSITVNPIPQAQIEGNLNGFCLSDTITLSLIDPGSQLLWSTGETSPEIKIVSGGVYSVLLTNTFGCSATASVTVSDAANISASILSENPACFGDETGSIIVDIPSGGMPPYLYSLNGSPFVPDGFWTGLTAGQYEIVVQDAVGCEYVDFVELNTPPPVSLSISNQNNFELKLGDSLAITAQTNQVLSAVQWFPSDGISCDTCLAVRFSPLETTDYELIVTNLNGCTASAQFSITVDERAEVFIPNVFSPNGDGINDGFTVFGGKSVEAVNRLLVMDRWGAVVFDRRNFLPNNELSGWNGTHKGESLQPGVYVYQAEVILIDGRKELMSGSVTLVR